MAKCISSTCGRKAATCGTASCARCVRKRRKMDQLDQQKYDGKTPGNMTAGSMHPCNPLRYILDRQVDDRVNYCKRLVTQRFHNAESLFRMDLYSHYGCVNAIEFSKDGDLLVSGGDDKRVLLWSVEKALEKNGSPVVMKGQHMSNIFCLGYNNTKTKIYSAGNDDQVIVHDLQTAECLNFFRHEKPVYGISAHPYNDNVFSSACDDGRVLIYDTRRSIQSPETVFCVAQHKSPFHSVMFSPTNPVMLATANAKEGVSMWDVRKPLKAVFQYGSDGPSQNCMNVRFNKEGTAVLALRRRLPPILYAADCAKHLCQFDHAGYFNSCTMKSCCFAGNNDEYILSGSDDFNLYMWKIPMNDSTKWVESAHMILRGHRSIVNQVRYDQTNCILASSGVEKIIKIWSPFAFSQGCLGGLKRDEKEEKQRRVYTHDEYIGLVLRSGQLMSHDYSNQSTDEDQRMMAFFDSLVQREIESWSSEDVPTPQNQSDPESPQNDYTTYEEDPMITAHQLMHCILRSRILNSYSDSSSSPEPPLESPNPITYLIANRRNQSRRLAALHKGSQSKTNATGTTQAASTATTSNASAATTSTTSAAASSEINHDSSSSEPENTRTINTRRCKTTKIVQKSNGTKRKRTNRIANRRNRTRRKQSNAKEDSDTELEESPNNNSYDLDAAQPSTSSGVISSRRLRYTTIASLPETQKRSRSISSSSEDENVKMTNGNANKRRFAKTDSDGSTKGIQKRKSSRIKSKTSSSVSQARRENERVKGKRQKASNDTESNTCNNSHNHRNNSRTPVKDVAVTHNGTIDKETSITPAKSSRHIATSDSGITSGISTTEKSSMRTRGESSDREKSAKNVESCKRKIDISRRNYRKRTVLRSSSSSDSSVD